MKYIIARVRHAIICYREGRKCPPGAERNCHYADAVRCLTGEAFGL